MRRSARSLVVTLALASLTVPLQGCLLFVAGAGAGAGAAWYYGAARRDVDADPRKVVDAARAALTNMDIQVKEHAATAVDGHVEGLTAQKDRVEILVNVRKSGETRISVRVGWIDDDAAERILDAIVARL